MFIGKKIIYLLDKKHASQAELAKFLNTRSANVSKWVNNIAFPRTETLRKIANFFNVDVDYLLKNEDNDNDDIFNSGNMAINSKDFTQSINQQNEQTAELLKLYNSLTPKNKTKFMMYGYELEEKQEINNNGI